MSSANQNQEALAFNVDVGGCGVGGATAAALEPDARDITLQ